MPLLDLDEHTAPEYYQVKKERGAWVRQAAGANRPIRSDTSTSSASTASAPASIRASVFSSASTAIAAYGVVDVRVAPGSALTAPTPTRTPESISALVAAVVRGAGPEPGKCHYNILRKFNFLSRITLCAFSLALLASPKPTPAQPPANI